MSKTKIDGASVCVVGGAGFLGSHLVNYLVDRGCRTLVVDNLCVGRREFVNPQAEFIHHDITSSEEFLTRLFRSRGIEYVFNYAAWPYIPDSFFRPLQVFDVNATGAIKVINAAHEAGCKGILQVSSAEIYGEAGVPHEGSQGERLTELAEIKPHSTYGAAKAAVDYYCQCAWRERKVPVVALRQFNCVGERETHPYVIPEIISQLYPGRRSGMYYEVSLGNDSRRDFLYAGDAVMVAVRLLERSVEEQLFGEVYNLGSESAIGIYDLAKLLGDLVGRSCMIRKDPSRVRPWEIWHLQSDNAKIRSLVGDISVTPLNTALVKTIDDYQRHDYRWCWEAAK